MFAVYDTTNATRKGDTMQIYKSFGDVAELDKRHAAELLAIRERQIAERKAAEAELMAYHRAALAKKEG